MRYRKKKQVTLLAQLYSYWFSWIVQARQGPDAEIERKNPATSIAARQCLIHTHERITPFGLQSFFIPTIRRLQQYYNSKPLNPTLTSLEEEAYAWIYTQTRRSSQGGTNPKETDQINWWRVNQCGSEDELSLLVNRGPDLGDTSTHTLTHQPKTHPDEPKCVEERGRAKFPIKDA